MSGPRAEPNHLASPEVAWKFLERERGPFWVRFLTVMGGPREDESAAAWQMRERGPRRCAPKPFHPERAIAALAPEVPEAWRRTPQVLRAVRLLRESVPQMFLKVRPRPYPDPDPSPDMEVLFPGLARNLEKLEKILTLKPPKLRTPVAKVLRAGDRLRFAVAIFQKCTRDCRPPLELPSARELAALAVVVGVDSDCQNKDLVAPRLEDWKKARARARQHHAALGTGPLRPPSDPGDA